MMATDVLVLVTVLATLSPTSTIVLLYSGTNVQKISPALVTNTTMSPTSLSRLTLTYNLRYFKGAEESNIHY